MSESEEFPLLCKYRDLVTARITRGMSVPDALELMAQPIDVTKEELDAVVNETPPKFRFEHKSGDFVASVWGLGGLLRFHVKDPGQP